ncbi:MAG: glycoside hydrolase family 98 domain-containing protein [Bacteroidota bacterium]
MLQVVASLCLLLSCFGFGRYLDGSVQAETTIVDFEPQKNWHLKGPISVRSDGRISLTQDGCGLVWKTVELDIDEFPLMLVRVTNSLPREWWRVVVEKNESPTFNKNREIVLIEKFAEEGGFIVPLKKKTGWSGKVKFVVKVVLDGRKGDRIVLDNLEAVKLTKAKPAAPKLSDPENGSVISPLAVHFSWYQATDAVEYELQVSRHQNFSENKSFKATPPYLADKLPYLPEELLPAGKWFWRVRAFNISGQASDWSETGSFTVREGASPRPPELLISADHPLLLLQSSSQHLVESWKSLPEELKPYTTFRIEEISKEQTQEILEVAQNNQIPVIFQVSGPHDYYGRTSSRIPLSEIEEIFLNFPVVKGIYLCEQAFRVSPTNNWIMMNYAERLIQLAAEYGKIVIWADGHWGRNLWIDVGLNEKLMNTIQKHHHYFIPVWKMNGSLTPYSAHDAVFGFWVGRAVNNWGVQPERWYWYEAGFGKLNQQYWFKEGVMADFPPTFYGQMILLGLSSGASVYALEPSGDIWEKDGRLSEISRRVTFPLLTDIIKNHWIPSREQILRKIQSVYVADSSDSHWSLDYGTMHALYKRTYGIKHPFEMIPSTSKYFWIPILPKWTPPEVLKSFPDQLSANRISKKEEMPKYFNATDDKGKAWIVHLDSLVIIMNSRENWDVDQTFEVKMKGKVKKITGRISVNSYVVAQEAKDELRLHLNGRSDRSQVLDLRAVQKPKQMEVTPASALVTSSWDATHQHLVLKFSLNQGAVNVRIGFSEKAK